MPFNYFKAVNSAHQPILGPNPGVKIHIFRSKRGLIPFQGDITPPNKGKRGIIKIEQIYLLAF